MSADKRIAVTEETWNHLGDLKSVGQTYDDVINALIEEHETAELFACVRENSDSCRLMRFE